MPSNNFEQISSGINLTPQSSVSGTPTNGDVYYNSSTNLFQFYQNGSFVTFNTGTGFLKADGSIPLTSNWAAGAFSATFNSVVVGSATNTVSGLSTIVNSGTLTLPSSTDTLLGRVTTDTLTNKSISGSTNTLTNIADGSLSTSYLKADGTRALTGDWASGSFRVSFGGGAVASTGIATVNPSAAQNPLTGVNQNAFRATMVATTAATTTITGFSSAPTSAAASSLRAYFYADTTAIGAGSTVRDVNYYINGVASAGSTGSAAIADNQSFSGSFFINSTSTNASLLSGQLTSASFIPTSSTVPVNGMYLPGTNIVSFATNTASACFIDANGNFTTQKGTANSYQRVVPTTGFSQTINNNVGWLVLNPAGTLATGTITMPSSPIDGQIVNIATSQQITASTVSPNGGQSLNGSPATIGANASVRFIWIATDSTWYRW